MTADLIARIESADGPSRELDEAIERAVGRYTAFQHYTLGDDDTPDYVPTRYTASIDAALTLVPDGALWSAETWDTNGIYPKHVRASVWVQGAPRCYAATPALALAAAALKARGV